VKGMFRSVPGKVERLVTFTSSGRNPPWGTGTLHFPA
jgi:hypothetical protein